MDEGKELTSFQKKRLENIKRNNELLRKLNLAKLSNSIGSGDSYYTSYIDSTKKSRSRSRRRF